MADETEYEKIVAEVRASLDGVMKEPRSDVPITESTSYMLAAMEKMRADSEAENERLRREVKRLLAELGKYPK